jgi:hypothetical protein
VAPEIVQVAAAFGLVAVEIVQTALEIVLLAEEISAG